MTLIERLPTLNDAEINNLLTNARRLSDAGDPARRAAATELLPALESEALARGQAKAQALAAARKARAPQRKAAA